MFYGSFEHSIDSKGRLSVPSRFREVLSAANETTFFITVDFVDSCIVAYTFSQWKKIVEKVSSLPANNKNVKIFLRRLNLKGSECALDKAGRILIPANLRAEIGIERDVVLVGMDNKIEIWAKENLIDSIPDSKEELEEINNNLSDLGL